MSGSSDLLRALFYQLSAGSLTTACPLQHGSREVLRSSGLAVWRSKSSGSAVSMLGRLIGRSGASQDEPVIADAQPGAAVAESVSGASEAVSASWSNVEAGANVSQVLRDQDDVGPSVSQVGSVAGQGSAQLVVVTSNDAVGQIHQLGMDISAGILQLSAECIQKYALSLEQSPEFFRLRYNPSKSFSWALAGFNCVICSWLANAAKTPLSQSQVCACTLSAVVE